MPLTRRQFLKWAGATGVGAVVFNGCRVPDHEIAVQSPVEMPEDLVTGRDNYYATAAQLGTASEGLLVRVMEGRAKKIEGNPDHPVNTGKHGIRAEALLQALYHPDRIKRPLLRIAKGGPFRRITWQEGIERLTAILQAREPGQTLIATPPLRGRIADVARGFAEGSGARLLGFDPLGGDQVVREAARRLYGQTAQPDFDIARAAYVLNFGADFLGTWGNPTRYARGYGEFRQGARRSRGKLTHIGARYSVTAAAADRWVYAPPGSEGLIAMAVANAVLDGGDLPDADAARALTGGRGAAALQAFAPSRVAAQTGVSEDVIREIARELAEYKPALIIGGGPAAAQANGLFNMTAVYALNALAGSVNRPGGLIFNPPPRSQEVPAASLREWRQALTDMRSGDVTAVLARDANLVHGLPGALDATGALRSVDTIVSFSAFLDETAEMADLILPCSTPLEEWGTDEPNPGPGYATIGFQQPAVNAYHDTLSFGDALLRAAGELGVAALPWENMREATRALAQELHEQRRGSVVQPTFAEFWKRTLERGGWWDTGATADASRPALPQLPAQAPGVPQSADASRYPYFLAAFEGVGVGAGQYAHLPWAQSAPDPITTAAWGTWVELNPHTADELGVKNNDIVIVESATGRTLRAPVYISPAAPPQVAAIPMGQGHRAFTGYAARRGANPLDIMEPAEEAETGAFAWGATRVRISATNRRNVVPKLEGIEPARQLHGEELIFTHTPGRKSEQDH